MADKTKTLVARLEKYGVKVIPPCEGGSFWHAERGGSIISWHNGKTGFVVDAQVERAGSLWSRRINPFRWLSAVATESLYRPDMNNVVVGVKKGQPFLLVGAARYIPVDKSELQAMVISAIRREMPMGHLPTISLTWGSSREIRNLDYVPGQARTLGRTRQSLPDQGVSSRLGRAAIPVIVVRAVPDSGCTAGPSLERRVLVRGVFSQECGADQHREGELVHSLGNRHPGR